jgi:hypothetical protein
LERLYREHGADGNLTLNEYKSMGGVERTIQLAINDALTDPHRPPRIPEDPEQQRDGLRRAFIPWLVRINEENNEPMRQVARMDQLPPGWTTAPNV